MDKKIALVTGSSRGIGRNIALRLADEAEGVIVHFNKNRDAAIDVVKEIEKKGKLSGYFQADLTQEDQAHAFIRDAEEQFGRIDILINNFGPILEKSWEKLNAEDWDYMWRGNLGSAFYCMQEALSGMRKRKWGRVVNMGFSRVEQLVAYRNIVPYAIAKTGLLILTRSVAASVASDGITVNMVSPGLIEGGVLPKDQNIPAGSLGAFDDVSSAVMFMISDQARYITGTNLVVSGGWKL
ncbi:MAG: SDR family oxidoreductase [Candidatus Aminicenantes bacterium]|nr:MAG: SDR family oxidoreductase [Candidatus Aminicenantes bacterium]